MHIVKLESQNVKRLKAVCIEPDGNAVVIGGNNAQGKSSVLDSIFMALGGKAAQGQNPVRDGADQAVIKCDLGELLVTRTINSDGNTKVTVKNADGASFSSPQAMLDALSSKLSFDPLAFAHEKPLVQLSMLKELVGLDFSDLESKRSEIYSARKEVNRKGKEQAARFAGMAFHPDAPAEAVSVSTLMDLLEEAELHNRSVAEKESLKQSRRERMEEIRKQLAALNQELNQLESDQANDSGLESYMDVDEIRHKISQADAINATVRENEAYKVAEKEVNDLRAQSQELTDSIKQIDQSKAELMASAKFPVAGLSFDESGVLFNGVPFSNCSSAERLLVSLHMGIAMNPKLKVLLIRDGSLLDDQSLATVFEVAQQSNAQVWIERVSKGEECSVIIEDGEVLNHQ